LGKTGEILKNCGTPVKNVKSFSIFESEEREIGNTESGIPLKIPFRVPVRFHGFQSKGQVKKQRQCFQGEKFNGRNTGLTQGGNQAACSDDGSKAPNPSSNHGLEGDEYCPA